MSTTSTTSCAICLNELDSDVLQLLCGHTYCKDCLTGWFVSQVNEKKLDLRCLTCSLPVERWILEDILPVETLEKYETFDLENTLEREFNLFHCPNNNCRNIVAAPDGVKHVECPECKKEYCMTCKTSWHTGVTCEKYKEWALENKDADALTLSFLEQGNHKKCPSCKVWIEKNLGCDHMTCKNCKHQFWWTSLEPYPHGKSNWSPHRRNERVIDRGVRTQERRSVTTVFLGGSSSFGTANRVAHEMRSAASTLASAVQESAVQESAVQESAVSCGATNPLPVSSTSVGVNELLALFTSMSDTDQKAFLLLAHSHRDNRVPDGPYTVQRLNLMTTVQLKAICRFQSLKISGTKEELVKRIVNSNTAV